MEPKGSQSEPRNLPKHLTAEQVQTNRGFDGVLGPEKGTFFIKIYQNITSKIIAENDPPKHGI